MALCVGQRLLRRLCHVGGVVARATIPLVSRDSKISAVGDLRRPFQHMSFSMHSKCGEHVYLQRESIISTSTMQTQGMP